MLLPLPLVEILVGLGKAGDGEGIVGIGGCFGAVRLSMPAGQALSLWLPITGEVIHRMLSSRNIPFWPARTQSNPA